MLNLGLLSKRLCNKNGHDTVMLIFFICLDEGSGFYKCFPVVKNNHCDQHCGIQPESIYQVFTDIESNILFFFCSVSAVAALAL